MASLEISYQENEKESEVLYSRISSTEADLGIHLKLCITLHCTCTACAFLCITIKLPFVLCQQSNWTQFTVVSGSSLSLSKKFYLVQGRSTGKPRNSRYGTRGKVWWSSEGKHQDQLQEDYKWAKTHTVHFNRRWIQCLLWLVQYQQQDFIRRVHPATSLLHQYSDTYQ